MLRQVATASVRRLSSSSFTTVVTNTTKATSVRCLSSTIEKTSTGLVGLPVDPNGVSNLEEANRAILEKIRAVPETAQYRTNVEQVSRYRLSVIEEHRDDAKKIEEEIDCGQIEEMIEQAKDELSLIDVYVKERVWELIEERDREAKAVSVEEKSS
uniref:Uncharacterized protein n=1 Tax=Corethron hystrix TaxID=216773 RepID=A0A7S1BDH5_9STRA|mmetsp:Transcript_23406/g.53415  ORF Transcript_23406/g.53415 Transcript_23406/m.53415 type:complete len:156 (+) Transcript_23406:224-691(+)|eukprot:CAMPEP_0113314492 /NCGR_PEP_ID=MMETSP0010_2-20120614/10529_1 /TAXON_ID=216773 ORGANISM="Corethron hystrix, Strain 308" /NCGR_SAMPLE_ID=MMETSP0010_2 /ASSEMBLY_ACC=CAM_ASM_000155 /LENGTH=155 /DNA_ID=CAMNT_0000170785 /DNA_START=143 /DNA_END=610 /DNA_ORIENTATION=- /assembly_acc=CAM_ASM_000155